MIGGLRLKVTLPIRPGISKMRDTFPARGLRRHKAVLTWNRNIQVIKPGTAIIPVKFGISFAATLFTQRGALVHVYPACA